MPAATPANTAPMPKLCPIANTSAPLLLPLLPLPPNVLKVPPVPVELELEDVLEAVDVRVLVF